MKTTLTPCFLAATCLIFCVLHTGGFLVPSYPVSFESPKGSTRRYLGCARPIANTEFTAPNVLHGVRRHSRAVSHAMSRMNSGEPRDRQKIETGLMPSGVVRQLQKTIVAAATATTLLGGSLLLAMPSETAANAAMAPSLMQDEKGYISIFEKVCGSTNRVLVTAVS